MRFARCARLLNGRWDKPMRVMIVSDTHGRHQALDEALERAGKIDMLLHLGDVEGGEEYIEAVADCPVRMVAGNNDFFSFLKKEREFKLAGKRIFMTHGHNYYVSMGTEMIREEGLARGVDIVMFGHTHKPYFEQDDKITVLNPGSLSFPRQPGRQGSYMIMEIKSDGSTEFETFYL